MIVHRCDGCGKEMRKSDLRYSVKIDVRAAYGKMEISLADLVRDHRAEILALIERMENKDPKELEESVYKSFSLDLCPLCQRAYIRDPLRFHPEMGETAAEMDIDGFLRSLGVNRPAHDDDAEDELPE
jgi:hypothetical protein